jgi:hypothetical protein
VLPVIEEPSITFSPCPSQTAPTRTSNAPRRRLVTVSAYPPP